MTNEKALEQLQMERDLIAGERELDGSQCASELLEALDMGITAIKARRGMWDDLGIQMKPRTAVIFLERILHRVKDPFEHDALAYAIELAREKESTNSTGGNNE